MHTDTVSVRRTPFFSCFFFFFSRANIHCLALSFSLSLSRARRPPLGHHHQHHHRRSHTHVRSHTRCPSRTDATVAEEKVGRTYHHYHQHRVLHNHCTSTRAYGNLCWPTRTRCLLLFPRLPPLAPIAVASTCLLSASGLVRGPRCRRIRCTRPARVR